MKRHFAFFIPLVLSACAGQFAGKPPDATTLPGSTTVAAPPADANTVDEFDTTTEADRQAALNTSAPSGESEVGRTIASLGNPADPGFWLETPLVTTPTKGRIVYPVTGTSVAVDLIPLDADPGAGSRISLPAMRLLGAPLTGLPELIVFAG